MEPFCQPNANTFHQIIMCLARDDTTKNFDKRLDETFQECMALAEDREIEIYADTFNVYMSGWLKSTRPTSLRRILAALDVMEKMYQDGNTLTIPNCVTMNTVLAAHVKFSGSDAVDEILNTRKRLQSTYFIKPDTTTFNTLIDAHAKSYRATADISALSLLQIMERHLVKGKKRAKPDCYSYCAVIDCLAKCNASGAGEQSRQILRRMTEIHQTHGGEQPTLSVYNAVFNAIAASSPVNLTSVKTLLVQMEQSVDDHIPKPSIITYNSAFKACLRSCTVHGAEWADKVLQSLEAKSTAESAIKPDSFSYTTVIAAYGRSLFPNKARKAAELVERALRHHKEGCLDGSPHVSIFNAACNACCFVDGDSDEKAHAFSTMVAISALLTNYTQPDETTYGTLLRACCQLLQRVEKQQAVVRQIFRKACNDGLCGDFVVKQIRFAADPETYKQLTGFSIAESIVREDIPHRWRRNAKYTNRWQKSQYLKG
uniref:Pentacotripeptide-repeat region of PRORP domain-containing protein n=1 Tax=Amphora coffeiformis TaxID=265554 RepID=A0A7S3P7E3_9STRA